VNFPAALATAGIVVILLAFIAVLWRGQRRSRRRQAALVELLDHADRLESDLKECRERLQRAHAVMSETPERPAAGEREARHALDSGLRALLQQRLWIRDEAPAASQAALDDAVAALARARRQIEPRLRALDEAQHALDSAVREHIRPESP
jgi:hypothetical protein